MIKTTDFSYDLIYEQIQDFCIEHNITKEDFRSKIPKLVYEDSTLFNNVTVEEGSSFCPSQSHPLFFQLTEYLEKKYSFQSKSIRLINQYENVFNLDEACSLERTYYLLDEHASIIMAKSFEFINLDNGDYDILIIEIPDSDLNVIEDYLFDFYKRNVIKDSLPEELQKPLTTLSTDAIDVIRMSFI